MNECFMENSKDIANEFNIVFCKCSIKKNQKPIETSNLVKLRQFNNEKKNPTDTFLQYQKCPVKKFRNISEILTSQKPLVLIILD